MEKLSLYEKDPGKMDVLPDDPTTVEFGTFYGIKNDLKDQFEALRLEKELKK